MTAAPVVLWDFDETLASRPGRWSGLLIEVLDEHVPGHSISLDAVRLGLRDGFPWHRSDEPHHHLAEPEAWWAAVRDLLAAAVRGAGLAAAQAALVAEAAAIRYRDPGVGWSLFDDTIAALEMVRRAGWRNAVLSNHIPELPDLVSGLGLDPYIEATFSSATTGYEKPHPEAFLHATRALGSPDIVWMVGDNPRADVQGAEAVGIPAVLVRTDSAEVPRASLDLMSAVRTIFEASG